jgi:hypothetical protein
MDTHDASVNFHEENIIFVARAVWCFKRHDHVNWHAQKINDHVHCERQWRIFLLDIIVHAGAFAPMSTTLGSMDNFILLF